MKTPELNDVRVLVWDRRAETVERVMQCFVAHPGVEVANLTSAHELPARRPGKPTVVLASRDLWSTGARSHVIAAAGLPVVWLEGQGEDPQPGLDALDSMSVSSRFTGSELRGAVAAALAQPAPPVVPVPEMLGSSQVMAALVREIDAFADCDYNVLVRGETGVGKELVARRLHAGHVRYGQGPFVAVNCGAIPEGLFESLFFGHTKGAFTGALQAHQGYFEQASGGTLFLDEVGDLPRFQQVKLLRVLESSVVTRLGSTTPITLDFRLVAATNRDLRRLVDQGEFRADLYYRLAVVEMQVPSLQQRGCDDKLAIFSHVLQRVVGSSGAAQLPQWLADTVCSTHFSGNVRQLRNLAERIGVIVRQTGGWDELLIRRALNIVRGAHDAGPEPLPPSGGGGERERIVAALQANAWRRQATALQLGISRKALWEKMRRHHIVAGDDEQAPAA